MLLSCANIAFPYLDAVRSRIAKMKSSLLAGFRSEIVNSQEVVELFDLDVRDARRLGTQNELQKRVSKTLGQTDKSDVHCLVLCEVGTSVPVCEESLAASLRGLEGEGKVHALGQQGNAFCLLLEICSLAQAELLMLKLQAGSGVSGASILAGMV